MSNPRPKIELGENHRRVVSVLMRGTERACDEVMEWLARSSGILLDVRSDLEQEEQECLRALAAALKAEVEEFASRVSLDKKRMARRRSVAAVVSATLADLRRSKLRV